MTENSVSKLNEKFSITNPNLHSENRMQVPVKRKRTDSHTFEETSNPQKIQKLGVDHRITRTGNGQIPQHIGNININNEVQPPPPPSTLESGNQNYLTRNRNFIPPPQLHPVNQPRVLTRRQRHLLITPSPIGNQDLTSPFAPPPNNQVSQQSAERDPNSNLPIASLPQIQPALISPPNAKPIVAKPKKRRKKTDSDEEYHFVEDEPNSDDYTIKIQEGAYYTSANPSKKKRKRNYDRSRPRKDHSEDDYVLVEEESSESIGEVNEILEEGELEDIKNTYNDMIQMEALSKGVSPSSVKPVPLPASSIQKSDIPPVTFEQNQNETTTTNPPPPQQHNPAPIAAPIPSENTATPVVTSVTTGEDSGNQKTYNFRQRKNNDGITKPGVGTFYRVSKNTPNRPFNKYDRLEKKRKKKNEKIRKLMRKARRNPRSNLPKLGDTTSSDDQIDEDVSRFLRTGPTGLQGPAPNSYTRIRPLNTGIESRRAGFKPPRADVDPIAIDSSITWDSIGGLKEHIVKLKEMVILPLLYPDVYTSLGIKPPRGVLFVGPPGTGKTLTARALCNMCKVSEQKEIAFFMRKGADILSKWVGEAEKQLRMLFERAKQLEPSIIFFDEIDGLAPVRSSKQDYIHTSIVSTLLALMDGLDDRGKVVVIGATNRADAVDPALRRPGRFDRELFFPLPDEKERKEILDIHTKDWKTPVPEDLKISLSKRAVGFCGADIKSLCTETGLKALRRKYPQIYSTSERLRIDVSEVQVTREDWEACIKEMTPSYYKTREFFPEPLNIPLAALFSNLFPELLKTIREIFPLKRERHGGKSQFQVIGSSMEDDPDQKEFWKLMGVKRESFVGNNLNSDFGELMIFKPSLLIFGRAGNGQVDLLKGLLHSPQLEYFRVYHLTLEAIYNSHQISGFTPEERLISRIKEVRSNAPCILAIPNILNFFTNLSDHGKNLFLQSVRSFSANLPILLLATLEIPLSPNTDNDTDDDLIITEEEQINFEKKEIQNTFIKIIPNEILSLFRSHFQILSPNEFQRTKFVDLFISQISSPIVLKNIPVPDEDDDDNEAKNSENSKTSFEIDESRKKELIKRLLKEEKEYLDQLQDCLYRICNTLLSDRHFKNFHRPKIEKPVGFRGRKKKEFLEFIVDGDEEEEYEEDILENNDPDAEYRPRVRKQNQNQNPLTVNLGIPNIRNRNLVNNPDGPNNSNNNNPQTTASVPTELVYVFDILHNVNSGIYETAKQFLSAFEIFRDFGGMYDTFQSFRGGGNYANQSALEEVKWKKKRLIGAGKNIYKRVEISLQTIDKGLVRECKRISKRRKQRREDELKKQKEFEDIERRKLEEVEKQRKVQEEIFPPQRRVTRGFLKKIEVSPNSKINFNVSLNSSLKPKGRKKKKKKKELKIKLPKLVYPILGENSIENWKFGVLEKTRGWEILKFQELYSLWIREITKFQWQPKRQQLLNNLETILNNIK